MMPDNWMEAAIILVIMLGLGVAIFKGGTNNPVSTGALTHKFTALDGDLRALKSKVGSVETRVQELDQRAATRGDIERVEARFQEWERKLDKIDRLDERLDALDLDVSKIQAAVAANHGVVEMMSESMRLTSATLTKIESKAEASAVVTDQVPAFMEKVLERVAGNSSRIEDVCKLVDRLYDFIVERGITK